MKWVGELPDDLLDEHGFINLEAYEVVSEPVPAHETPRQFLLHMTRRDFPELADNGRDFTWQEVRDAGMEPLITRMFTLAYRPRILLKKRESEQDT